MIDGTHGSLDDPLGGAYLYQVHAIIDTWSLEKAVAYAARGYVHCHELIAVEGGALHPTKVVWLKPTARTSFTLDGGPHPELAHEVTPGVDMEFMPNYLNALDHDVHIVVSPSHNYATATSSATRCALKNLPKTST